MGSPRHHLYVVDIVPRMKPLQAVKLFERILGQDITREGLVLASRAQRKGDVGTVFSGCILQRFSPGNRSGSSQVVRIERCKPLASVGPFRDAEEIDPIGVYFARDEGLTQEFFPSPLLGHLPPTVIVSFIRNLRDKISRRSIVKTRANDIACAPLVSFGPRAVHIDKERPSGVGFCGSFGSIVIGHHRIRFILREVKAAALGLGQRLQLGQFVFGKRTVGSPPRIPDNFLRFGHLVGCQRSRCRVRSRRTIQTSRKIFDIGSVRFSVIGRRRRSAFSAAVPGQHG